MTWPLTGRIDVQSVDIELNPILRESLLQASPTACARGTTLLGVDPDSSPVHVWGDAKRLKQVIDNLLSNAVKYTQPGGLVSVTSSEVGTCVEIAVQDSGPGLSAEQLKRMFMPFDRLGAERTSTPGTGLGLALSKTLVELMGGSMRVESLPGVGSTFIVSLQKKVRSD